MNPVSSTYFLFDGISLAVLNSLMPQGFLERPYTWKNVKQISKDYIPVGFVHQFQNYNQLLRDPLQLSFNTDSSSLLSKK